MTSVKAYFYNESYKWKLPELLFRQSLDWRNLQVSRELWWAVVDNGWYLLNSDVIGREYFLWTQHFCVFFSQFRRNQVRSKAEAVPPPSQICTKRGGEGQGSLIYLLFPLCLSASSGPGWWCFFPTSLGWLGKSRQAAKMCLLPIQKLTHWPRFWGKGAPLQTWGQKGDFHF